MTILQQLIFTETQDFNILPAQLSQVTELKKKLH